MCGQKQAEWISIGLDFSYTYNHSESVVAHQVTGRSNRLFTGLLSPTAVYTCSRVRKIAESDY